MAVAWLAVEKARSIGGRGEYTEAQMNWLLKRGFARVDPGDGSEDIRGDRPIFFRGGEYSWVAPHVRWENGGYVDVPGRYELWICGIHWEKARGLK